MISSKGKDFNNGILQESEMMSYDRNKTVAINDVFKGFLTFIDLNNLTLTERLLVNYLWEYIKSELMQDCDDV